MKRSVKLICISLIVSAVFMAGPVLAAPAVLQYMPADAAAIVVTKPLLDLSAKVDLFARQIGLPIPPEQPLNLAALLGAQLATQLGTFVPVDADGEFGLAIGDFNNPEQSMVAFIPVKDPQALIDTLANKTDAGGGIWALPSQACVKAADKYLLMSPNADVLNALSQGARGVTLSDIDAQLFSQSDFSATFNLSAVMGMLEEKALQEIRNDPELGQMLGLQQMASMVIERVVELQQVSVGGRLGQSGVNLDMNFQAVPGSRLAGFLANHPATDYAELSRLPAGDYAAAYVFDMNSKAFEAPLNALLDAVAEDPNLSVKIGPENIAKMKSLIRRTCALGSAGAFATYVPSMPTDPNSAVAVQTKMMGVGIYRDAKQALALMPEWCELTSDVVSQFGFNLPMAYKANAGQIAGVPYGEVAVDLSQLPLPPEAMQAMALQYGGQLQFVEQLARIDNQRLAIGVGPGALKEMLEFAGSGQPGLNQDPALNKVADNLPAKANFFGFGNVGNAMRSMLSQPNMPPQAMMMMGLLGQMQGTVGMAATLDAGAVQMNVFIPSELIQSGVMMAMQMQAQMMGGQGPGGAQPPPTF